MEDSRRRHQRACRDKQLSWIQFRFIANLEGGLSAIPKIDMCVRVPLVLAVPRLAQHTVFHRTNTSSSPTPTPSHLPFSYRRPPPSPPFPFPRLTQRRNHQEETLLHIHPEWRRTLLALMEQPTSSPSAFLIHILIFLIVLIAPVTVSETVPAFHLISVSVWFGFETSWLRCGYSEAPDHPSRGEVPPVSYI